jgi:hypothetical protein
MALIRSSAPTHRARDTIIFSTGPNSFQSTILFDGNETVGIQHVGILLSIIGRNTFVKLAATHAFYH